MACSSLGLGLRGLVDQCYVVCSASSGWGAVIFFFRLASSLLSFARRLPACVSSTSLLLGDCVLKHYFLVHDCSSGLSVGSNVFLALFLPVLLLLHSCSPGAEPEWLLASPSALLPVAPSVVPAPGSSRW